MQSFFDGMIQIVTTLINQIISLLPRSPFREYINGLQSSNVVSQYMGYLNWFFPVGACLNILSVWLIAVGLFYLYSIIMRWAKLIGD